MTDNISALAADWIDAKRQEAVAQARRYAIEDQLSEALDVPQEGSRTHKLDGYKVTLTQPVTRKVDPDAWDRVKGLALGFEPVKVKLEVDGPGVKWLEANKPELWRAIAPAFETKPGKIGVKVERTS